MRGVVNHLDTYNPYALVEATMKAWLLAALDSPVHCFSVDYRSVAGKGNSVVKTSTSLLQVGLTRSNVTWKKEEIAIGLDPDADDAEGQR